MATVNGYWETPSKNAAELFAEWCAKQFGVPAEDTYTFDEDSETYLFTFPMDTDNIPYWDAMSEVLEEISTVTGEEWVAGGIWA